MDGRCLFVSCCEKEQKEEVGERYKKWCNELKNDTDLYSLYKNKKNNFISDGRLGHKEVYGFVSESLNNIKTNKNRDSLEILTGGKFGFIYRVNAPPRGKIKFQENF